MEEVRKKQIPPSLDQHRLRLKQRIMEEMNQHGQTQEDGLSDLIDREITGLGQEIFLPLKDRIWLRTSLYDSFRRLDILQELMDDPAVSEIMVNGPDRIFIERSGRIEPWPRHFDSRQQLEDMIQQIVGQVNRMVNTASPIVDARLEDGSRVHVVLPPIALEGPVVTIRKFPEPITMERLLEYGTLTPEAADFLKQMVRARYNLFISGGTNSGKTTFLNALSEYIPESERVITIEDSAELQLRHIPNLVRLETRNANTEGEGEITISQLIRASLRMRPDRIVVGEVRGGEALDMLQAMNTGHDGSLSTGHGNSPEDMLTRLETMVLMAARLPLEAVRSQIASALDLMIHLGRLRDGSRRVISIAEIGGCEDGKVERWNLFRYSQERRRLEQTGELKNREKLGAAGYSQGAV